MPPKPHTHTSPTLPAVCRGKEPEKGCAHPLAHRIPQGYIVLGRHLGQESVTCLPANLLFRLKDKSSYVFILHGRKASVVPRSYIQ